MYLRGGCADSGTANGTDSPSDKKRSRSFFKFISRTSFRLKAKIKRRFTENRIYELMTQPISINWNFHLVSVNTAPIVRTISRLSTWRTKHAEASTRHRCNLICSTIVLMRARWTKGSSRCKTFNNLPIEIAVFAYMVRVLRIDPIRSWCRATMTWLELVKSIKNIKNRHRGIGIDML